MAKKKTAVAPPSKDLIRQYFLLEGKRKVALREAESLKKQLKPYIAQFTDYVRTNGGKSKTVLLHGTRISIEMVDGSPSWKGAYIALVGSKAAEKLKAKTPSKECLKVQRVKK